MTKGAPHEYTNLMEELDRMYGVAQEARATDGEAANKWQANSELISFIRTNIFPILSALRAGADLCGRPNGHAKQHLCLSLRELMEAINVQNQG